MADPQDGLAQLMLWAESDHPRACQNQWRRIARNVIDRHGGEETALDALRLRKSCPTSPA